MVVGDCAVLMVLVLALGLALGARILFQGLVLRCGDLEPRFKTGYVTGISVRVSMARGGSMGWVAAAEGDGTLVLLLLHIVGNTVFSKKMFNAWFDLCARNDFKGFDGFVPIFPAISNGKDGDQVVIAVVVIETVVGAVRAQN